MRYQKRVQLFPGFTLNLSSSGISSRIGPKGASITIGKKGTFANLGVPGTGLSHRLKLSDKPKQGNPENVAGSVSGSLTIPPMPRTHSYEDIIESVFLPNLKREFSSADIGTLTSS